MSPESLKDELADRYVIEDELGRGGMAVVYRARDLRHGRVVAIKALHQEIATAIGRDRFLSEIRIAAQLSHPHIVPLYDSGEAGGTLYFVMPCLSGESLRQKLLREGPLDTDAALEIVREVADALAYAHRQGLVHRDIKPENILLSEGHATVADFGIARAMDSVDGERLTQTGLLVGSPAYMSPEQATGDTRLDGRSDVYSLGCVAYEMLAGEPPFVGVTAAATMAKRFADPVPSVRDRRPDVAEVVAHAISRAMSLDADSRFPTVAEFAQAVNRLGAATPTPVRKSITVLPFANVSSDPENEYFSDGLTEELIADLSTVRSLHVISRTSAMQMKGTKDDLRTIGRKLGVRYVLEGSVRKSVSGLRITAQLIDATTDEHLWSDKFSGTGDDVFNLQERVSREIVRALDLTLSSAEDRRLAARPIADQRVLDCYFRARTEINTLRAEALDRACDLLLRGLELSPANSLLEAMLGTAEVSRAKTAAGYDERLLNQAEDRARRVMVRDPELPQGPFLQGLVAFARGQLTDAARHLKRALEIEPNYADALIYHTLTYFYAGHPVEARSIGERLVVVDPLSALSWVCAAAVEWADGRLEDAVAPSERSVAVEPQSLVAHWMHGYVLALNGRYSEAEGENSWLTATSPDSPYRRQLAGILHGAAGRMDAAREVLAPLASVHLDHHESFHIAESYAMSGDIDRALVLLESAVEKGFYPLDFMRAHNPLLKAARAHPRFTHVVERALARWTAFAP